MEVIASFLQNAIADLDELDSLDDIKFVGKVLTISTSKVITPPSFFAFGGGGRSKSSPLRLALSW